MKKTISLRISEDVLEEFGKTGINRSQFCEDCMRTYVQFGDDGLGKKIQALEDDIKELEYQKYILASRYSQDFENAQEINEKIPAYWTEFTDKAGDLFFGLCDVEDFDDLRMITGLLKRDLLDLSEYLVDNADAPDHNLLCTDFRYCIKKFNKDKERNLRSDLI